MGTRRVTRRANVNLLIVIAVLLTASTATAPRAATADDDTARYVNVVGRVPLEDDAIANQIVVFFDKPITLPAGPTGSSPAPFTCTPAIPGEFEIGVNFVALRIDNYAIRRDAVYDVALNDKLQSADGKALNPQQRHFTVSGFPFGIASAQAEPRRVEHFAVDLQFSAPVNPDVIKANLSVVASDGQSPVPFTLEAIRSTAVRLLLPVNVEAAARIVLRKGTPDAGGKLKTRTETVMPLPAPVVVQPRTLTVYSFDWTEFTAKRQSVGVSFSEPVKSEDLKKRLTITDSANGREIPFELVQSRDDESRARIVLHASVTDELKVNITIADGLSGKNGGVLQSSVTKDLLRRLQMLRIEQTHVSQTDRLPSAKDNLVLYIQFNKPVNSSSLKSHLECSPALEEMRIIPARYGGLEVTGQWKSRQAYELKVTPGLEDDEGLVVRDPITSSFRTGDVPRYVGFGLDGRCYFPRRNGLKLPLESRNTEKTTVTLHRMFPSNLEVALADMQDGKGSFRFNEAWCQYVGSATVTPAKDPDRIVQTPLDLDTLFPQGKKGVFCLAAEGSNATRLVLWTNIGVLAHWRQDSLSLFVHDLFTLEPLSPAQVSVYSSKNQLLGMVTTDANGMAELNSYDRSLGSPRVAVVEWKDDFTFLELIPRKEDLDEIPPNMPPYSRGEYDAFIYADRDLYRPGETVHARWTVRKNYGEALANVPVIVRVRKPDGKPALEETMTLSAVGTGGMDIVTKKTYPTGKYTVELGLPTGGTLQQPYPFSLEEFVPNRMKVAVQLDSNRWKAGQESAIHLSVQHLFGAPAPDRKCDAAVVMRRGGFTPANWKGYRFENDSNYTPDPASCGERQTDEKGAASFTFTFNPTGRVSFPMTATVMGRAFELGGRAVGGSAQATLFPSEICLGIKAGATQDRTGLDVSVAAITPEETPAALAKVNVSLERQDWYYNVRRYFNYYQPSWSEQFETIETREVALTEGKGVTTFTTPDYGYYRVRVHAPETPQYSTVTFSSYGGHCQLSDAARPNLIKLIAGKPSYAPGEDAELRIESPFDGKGIAVVQGEKIYAIRAVDVKNNVGVVHVPLTSEMTPNVWVGVTVVHALKTDAKQVYPFSSFAMISLPVSAPQQRLTVTFPNLPKELLPKESAQWEIDVHDAAGNPVAAELTLAAVDEGIHSITDYKNPDPASWFFRSRRPDFRRAHYYDKVAYELLTPSAGGDTALKDLGKRLSNVDENWIKPVALWSGAVQSGADGKAVVSLPIPEFAGQLRLVSVACSATGVGAGSDSVLVRRPHVLRTSLPRMLLPGDTMRGFASVYNNTDAACKARVSWNAGGTVRSGAGSAELEVPARGEASCQAEFVAGQAIGAGEIRWEAVISQPDGAEIIRLTETDPIPVRPPAAYQSQNEVIILKAGETRELRNTRFADDERSDVEVIAGASPLLQIQDALRYLVHYPYGCIEQTTSALLPMYLLRRDPQLLTTVITSAGDDRAKLAATLDNYIPAGIERLFTMQTAQGGLSYWPGGDTPYDYGSVYALHFLTLVKRDHQYPVPERALKELQQYVSRVAAGEGSAYSILYLQAYAIYVLALDGDLNAVQQISRFDAIKMPRSARLLLAAALAVSAKDNARVTQYLATAPAEAWNDYEPYGTLNTAIRTTALELLLAQNTGTTDEKRLELADTLVQYLKTRRYGTTQETAFVVTALSEYLSSLSKDSQAATGTVTVAGKTETLTGTALVHVKSEGKGSAVTVANTGVAPIYVSLTTRGVPEKPDLAAISQGGLRVSRQFLTDKGERHQGSVFKQTDSYIVDVVLSSDSTARNVVVDAILPAGLEVENPRPNTSAISTTQLPPAAVPSFLDVRDDRVILAFNQLSSGETHFYFVVHAVTPGNYVLPATLAECMYDARISARTEGGAIEVK